MKKLLILCTTLAIIFLSACSHAPSPPEIPPGTSEAITTEHSVSAYEETEEPAGETTSSCSQSGKETSSEEIASTTGESLNTTEPVTTDIPPTTETEDESVVETTSATETSKPTEPKSEEPDPVETEPPETSEPVATETTPPLAQPTKEPTEPAPTTMPETVPEETTEPPATEPSEPEFDIDYWISYAGSYAQSVGLLLNAEAVYCWDNPIGAGAHCMYLEQDIQSRLNRYAKDEDITDVWIWAEAAGEGRYNLYIGYA